MQSETV